MQKITKDIRPAKIATIFGVIGLALCVSAGMALAAKPGGGGHPGGGHPGGGHPGGGGRPGGGVHINAARAPTPHFNAARIHVNAARIHAAHSNAVTTRHNFASGGRGRHAVRSSVKTNAGSRLAHVHNGHGPKTTNNAKHE